MIRPLSDWRTVAKFLTCLSEGAPVTRKEFKTMADFCWLHVPMKYRMDKAERAEIMSHPWEKERRGAAIPVLMTEIAKVFKKYESRPAPASASGDGGKE